MKRKLLNFSRLYEAALRRHLKQGLPSSLEAAPGLGAGAAAAGLRKLDLIELHEHILVVKVLPRHHARERIRLINQAGRFFAMAIHPLEKSDRSAYEAALQLNKFIETLSRRTVDLATSNLELSRQIIERKTAEKLLKRNERHYVRLLEESDRLQEQLRRLSRQIIWAQEDERKQISRELHDVIAQTLSGINIRLATLKKEAALNANGLGRNIASTQRLVEKSVNIVHRFARELRPTVLDDIGLIPALHSFMKNFSARTGVRTRLTSFAGIEKMDAARRTVFFRVAQEALTNVARHAQAKKVEVSIRKLSDCICMKIKDDGKSFRVRRVLFARGGKRLGLLGMRERLEMVDGHFEVESSPGMGTTVTAKMPLGKEMS